MPRRADPAVRATFRPRRTPSLDWLAVPRRHDLLRRLAALLGALALAGFTAACGDEDEGGDRPGTTTQQAETTVTMPETSAGGGGEDPESTFLAFQTALADGDADTVCGSLTPSAVEQVEEASIGGKCDTWVDEISKLYDASSKAKLKRTKVDSVDEKGDKATVKYESPILNLPLEAELEKDGDVWRISKLAENV
jgi:hypothetical protein